MSKAKREKTEAKGLFGEMATEAADLKKAAHGSVTETVAGWLTPAYAVAAHHKIGELAGDDRLAALQGLMHDWVKLRRSDIAIARLQLRREELEWQRTNRKLEKEKEFDEWIKRPEIREKYLPDASRGITPETIAKIEKELRLF